MKIIGLTGKAGVGKDTVADYLVADFGFVKRSMAAPMKQMLNDRFGWTMDDWNDRTWKERVCAGTGFSPRSWGQWLGTEVGRALGPNVWVDLMVKTMEASGAERIVIPDIRFDNEAAMVRDLGGRVFSVRRDHAQAVETHVSESGINPRHIYAGISNNGSFKNLAAAVDRICWDYIGATL